MGRHASGHGIRRAFCVTLSKWLVLSIALLSLWLSSDVAAQVYRWVDEQGGVHYEQSMDRVPERYRATIRPYTPPAPTAAPAPEQAPSRTEQPEPLRPEQPQPTGPRVPDTPIQREAPRTANVRGQLSWPIRCQLGIDCRINNFPDPAVTAPKSTACPRKTYGGHLGTDIDIVPAHRMDSGVDVLAAADGFVLWAFDGMYDRCPDPTQEQCREPRAQPRARSVDGYRVCMESGPFCRDGRNGCFWCFTGNFVVVLHKNAGIFATSYHHLKKLSVRVKAGQVVARGEKLGEVGSSGRSFAPHLHFEVWDTTYYEAIDPWPCESAGHLGLWQTPPLSGLR